MSSRPRLIYHIGRATRDRAITDIHSRFYKEHLGGERDNYIHKIAGYDHTNYLNALKQTCQDTVACTQRIEQVLAGKGEYEKAWYHHKTGYIYMHIMRNRYRLWQLGIGDKPADKEALI